MKKIALKILAGTVAAGLLIGAGAAAPPALAAWATAPVCVALAAVIGPGKLHPLGAE